MGRMGTPIIIRVDGVVVDDLIINGRPGVCIKRNAPKDIAPPRSVKRATLKLGGRARSERAVADGSTQKQQIYSLFDAGEATSR